jgi:hypothetical protein
VGPLSGVEMGIVKKKQARLVYRQFYAIGVKKKNRNPAARLI